MRRGIWKSTTKIAELKITPPRLTENWQAVKLLRSKFVSGELDGSDEPEVAHSSNPIFR